jgi:hypothetical protein
MDRIQLSWANVADYDQVRHDADKRRPGRVVCDRLGCRHGRVCDLSSTGARIEVRAIRSPTMGRPREIVFDTEMGESSPFICRVVWTKRVSLRRFQAGIEFLELTEPQRTELARIARVHAVQLAIGELAA